MTEPQAMPFLCPGKVGRWPGAAHNPVALWLGKRCVVVAWLGLLASVLSPPHGSGFLKCWFQGATGVPCPGCGLTRSLSCGLRGMFLESWHYHPMGLLILALFGFTALYSLLPEALRNRLTRSMEARTVLFQALYAAFVTAFITFGVARALLRFWEILLNS